MSASTTYPTSSTEAITLRIDVPISVNKEPDPLSYSQHEHLYQVDHIEDERDHVAHKIIRPLLTKANKQAANHSVKAAQAQPVKTYQLDLGDHSTAVFSPHFFSEYFKSFKAKNRHHTAGAPTERMRGS